MVRVNFPHPLLRSSLFVVEFHKAVEIAILYILERLKHSDGHLFIAGVVNLPSLAADTSVTARSTL